MKANEAPEMIYCESDGLGNIVKVHNIKWPDDEAENIEYTRTDAFIEKALFWLKNHYRDYMHNPTGKKLEAFFGRDMCNDFENYMIGE